MKKIFPFLSLLLVIFSCNTELPELEEVEVLEEISGTEISFEVNVASTYNLGLKSWIVLSHLNGDIIEFEELPSAGQYTYEFETEEENQFNATIIRYNEAPYVEDEWDIGKWINLKTYAFLDGEVNILNLNTAQNSGIDPSTIITVDASLNVDENDFKESVLSGTLTGIKNSNSYPVQCLDGKQTIFTYVHLNDEYNWRMKFFENVQDNSSIVVNLDEMEEISTRFVFVPDFYDASFRTIGIISCEEDYYHSLQWHSPADNGCIASRYLPENNGMFSHYLTDITLSTEDEIHQNIRVGEPITEYMPVGIDYTVNESSLESLQLQTSSEPFTVYELNYSKINSLGGYESNSTNWTIYGDFNSSFVAPDLTEVLMSDADWFDHSSLELYEVKEYNFSEHSNYNDWLESTFDPVFTNNLCTRNGLNMGEEVNIRSTTF